MKKYELEFRPDTVLPQEFFKNTSPNTEWLSTPLPFHVLIDVQASFQKGKYHSFYFTGIQFFPWVLPFL